MPKTTTMPVRVTMTIRMMARVHGITVVIALALREEGYGFDHTRCHDAAATVMTSTENEHGKHSKNCSKKFLVLMP